MAKKMRAIVVSRPRGPLEVVERDIPEPTAGTVRIKVEACGVCHSDVVVVDGLIPGIQYPRIPGHEVVGTIDSLGPGVTDLLRGQRVGVGWNGGYDGRCDACRRGELQSCRLGLVTGVSSDGGYAEYMIARAEAVARFPEGLSGPDTAPMLCAGLTTFNALRNSGARAGDLVAILGVGGLGHLGVQFASKMGFRAVAIARGKETERLAAELGASARCRRRAHEARGCQGHSLHGDERGGDERRHRRPLDRWDAARHWRSARTDPGVGLESRQRRAIDQGLVRRNIDRLGRHARLRKASRRAIDERALPDGPRRRGLREDDERQGSLSRCPHDGLAMDRCWTVASPFSQRVA